MLLTPWQVRLLSAKSEAHGALADRTSQLNEAVLAETSMRHRLAEVEAGRSGEAYCLAFQHMPHGRFVRSDGGGGERRAAAPVAA